MYEASIIIIIKRSTENSTPLGNKKAGTNQNQFLGPDRFPLFGRIELLKGLRLRCRNRAQTLLDVDASEHNRFQQNACS